MYLHGEFYNLVEEVGSYFKIDHYAQDAMIKKTWLVALDVTVRRKVPADWHRHIDAMEIGKFKKEESRYATTLWGIVILISSILADN